jgi:hypothetical protein
MAEEYFIGYARVNLDALDFSHEWAKKYHRSKSKKVCNGLERIFGKDGCKSDEAEHAISAIIDLQVLHDAGRSELPAIVNSRVNVPQLDLRYIECLHGLHRIEAAKAFLKGNDKMYWWTVKFYSKGKMPSQRSRSLPHTRLSPKSLPPLTNEKQICLKNILNA